MACVALSTAAGQGGGAGEGHAAGGAGHALHWAVGADGGGRGAGAAHGAAGLPRVEPARAHRPPQPLAHQGATPLVAKSHLITGPNLAVFAETQWLGHRRCASNDFTNGQIINRHHTLLTLMTLLTPERADL